MSSASLAQGQAEPNTRMRVGARLHGLKGPTVWLTGCVQTIVGQSEGRQKSTAPRE